MRDLNRIILHCSATREGKDFSADTIRGWHVNGNGWSDIGYHWVIRLDGSIEVGRPLEKSGAHTKGHNKDSVGVCYIGGCDADGKPKDTMSQEQEKAWRMIVLSLRTLYGDHITIHGHNEYANKACPSFIVEEKFADMY